MTNDVKLQNQAVGNSALPKKKKKRKSASLDRRKSRSGWFFVLPFLIGFLFIYFPIIFDSIKLSFMTQEIVQGGGVTYNWVGFENYKTALFVNPNFVKTLVTGLEDMIFQIPAIIIFSLFMAVLLNQKMAGRALFRAIFFVPVILSTGIMENIDMTNGNFRGDEGISDGTEGMTSSSTGTAEGSGMVSSMDVENLFAGMRVGTGLVDMVVKWINNILEIVNRSGVQMLIFLAGLQSISPAIYESCQIDGATAWETFWKITFPMISPMILVNAVYTVIDSFTAGNNKIMAFIESAYTTDGGSVSSAMSWMYFLIVILIVAVIAGICSAFVFYQRKND